MCEKKTLRDFGAAPAETGCMDVSAAFAAASEYFTKTGGGFLVVEPGTWYTGPVRLVSGMTLEIVKGAVISFIPEPERYTPVYTRWEGVVCYGMHPCIFASNAENIHITGSGCFDGSGESWWKLLPEKKKQGKPVTELERQLAALNPGYEFQPGGGGGRNTQFLRPPLIQFFDCTDVSISGVTFLNSPFWTVHPVFCRRLIIDGITVKNPPAAPNTDGIDIDSCEDVVVKNSCISVGDDGIAVKSGSGEDGIRVNKPSRNVTISGCRVENAHGGVVIGSETAAGISDVTVENCVFDGTERGIRIKTRRGRGGVVEKLKFSGITMQNNLCPVTINMFYRCGTCGTEPELFCQEALPVKADTPVIRDVTIHNVKAFGCRASAGFIAALPEVPLERLTVTDCEFITDENDSSAPSLSDMFAGIPDVSEKSFRVINAVDPVFTNVRITGPAKPFLFR